MIEPEMCFINSKDLMDISEDFIKHCINLVLLECNDEIDFLGKNYQDGLKEQLNNLVKILFQEWHIQKLLQL